MVSLSTRPQAFLKDDCSTFARQSERVEDALPSLLDAFFAFLSLVTLMLRYPGRYIDFASVLGVRSWIRPSVYSVEMATATTNPPVGGVNSSAQNNPIPNQSGTKQGKAVVPTNHVTTKDGVTVRARIDPTLNVEDVIRQLCLNLKLKDPPAMFSLRDEEDTLVTTENLNKMIKSRANLKCVRDLIWRGTCARHLRRYSCPPSQAGELVRDRGGRYNRKIVPTG